VVNCRERYELKSVREKGPRGLGFHDGWEGLAASVKNGLSTLRRVVLLNLNNVISASLEQYLVT
jgi:hypothetical protein